MESVFIKQITSGVRLLVVLQRPLVELLIASRHADGQHVTSRAPIDPATFQFTPPPGKLIRIVATALSDEHIFSLQGGRSTKSGQRAQGSGGYGLNPKGQPHSAMISAETTALVIYAGEPDEIKSMEIVDIASTG